MEPKKAVFPPLIPFVICSIAGYLMGVMAAGSFSLAAGAAWLVGMAAAIVVVRLLLGTSLRVALGYGRCSRSAGTPASSSSTRCASCAWASNPFCTLGRSRAAFFING